MTQASDFAWFNGEIVPRETGAPSVASINFHLGTGVFDGLIAYWNNDHYYIHCAEQHLVRFIEGTARVGLKFPWNVEELLAGIRLLLAKEPVGTQYIRPIAYRRAPELWVTGSEGRPVDVSIFTVKVERDCDVPLTCHLSPIERVSSRAIPGHTKISGAYVNSFNARRTAEAAGFQDGLMLDREGRITEASAANFFAIEGERLITPPINPDVFPGITRLVVLDLACKMGIECAETDIRPDDLATLDGALLCSTLMEVRALSKLDSRSLATQDNKIFRALVEAFRNMTHQ